MIFSNNYTSYISFKNEEEEILHFSNKCYELYSAGIKSTKLLADLCGIEQYYVLLMLIFKCGITPQELKPQCSLELIEAISKKGIKI